VPVMVFEPLKLLFLFILIGVFHNTFNNRFQNYFNVI